MFDTRRREFITLLGGSAAWPFMARAQGDSVRRVGWLMSTGERDSESQLRLGAFREGLQKLGWAEGRNLRIDYRWGGGSIERMRTYAAELVALKPDVILGAPSSAAVALHRETRTIPVVFAQRAFIASAEVQRIRALATPGRPKVRVIAERRQTACARRFLPAMIDGGTRGRELHVRHQAARVHDASWRRGCVAARGAGAATWEAADGRLCHQSIARWLRSPCRRVHERPQRTRLR